MTAPWYANGLRFECQPDCGACCKIPAGSMVAVTDAEAERIAKFLGMKGRDFRKKFLLPLDSQRYEMKPTPSGNCPMLDSETKRCTVNAVKPVQCDTFPFWRGVLASPESWAAAGALCPGVNVGPIIPLAEIKVRRARSAVVTDGKPGWTV